MKKIGSYLLIIILIASCGQSSNNTSNSHESVSNDTLSENSTEQDVWPQNVEGYVDTLVPFEREIEANSKFSTPQIKEGVYYQYYKNDFPVYDSFPLGNKVSRINIGEKVHVNYISGDFHFMEGFIGYITEVKLPNDSVCYTSNNFLLPLPYPGEELKERSLLGYLQFYLHETGPTIEKGAFHGEKEIGLEDERKDVVHHFENGIEYKTENYYESHSNIVHFPQLTIEKGLLFIDALFTDRNFLEIFDGFPKKEKYEFEDDEWGSSFAEVDCDFGAILVLNSVKIYIGDGCGEWYFITPAEKGIQIETGSGC